MNKKMSSFSLSLMTVLLVSTSALAKPAQDPDKRAAEVEAQMTDDERFRVIRGIMPVPGTSIDPKEFEGIPVIAGYVKGVERLGIPDLLESDASLGIANSLLLRDDKATALPSGLAIASTFDPELARQGGAMVGAEARARGFNVLLGGGVNLVRDPRNGRNFEYLGEDPLLAGILGGAAIAGTQSQGVISTVKHLSLNAQETLRHWLDARIDEAAHRESDLLAFKIAIEKGQPGSVMCAYNKVNGHYSCGNDHLLNKVLKQDWGYKGWVMSDWTAVHDVSYFNAGLDQQSGSQLDKQLWFDGPLKAELAAGRVTRERLSDAVRRILRSIYAVGADWKPTKHAVDQAAHDAITRNVAAKGMVLLKNDGALPIAASAKNILVVGGHAHFGVMSGGGSSQVTPVGGDPMLIPMGGPKGSEPYIRQLIMPSSPLEALKAALPDSQIVYDNGHYPEQTAKRAAEADLVILFATQWQIEGFDAGMTLPAGQDALIDAVANANPTTVVVLETGNPVRMPWLGKVKAVLEAWYPGSSGGPAIADVLTGKVNPSGRLPITWPVDETQNPRPEIPGLGKPDGTQVTVNYTEGSDVGYRWFAKEGKKPLFPFGFGLSYTSFSTGGLAVKGSTATFTVTNTGKQAGDEVAQLYLVSRAGEKIRRLAGFQRVSLQPGKSQRVKITIDARLLADWKDGGWSMPAGNYGFALGRNAEDLGTPVTVRMPAKTWRD